MRPLAHHLQAHGWPGNVRELRHAIERASGGGASFTPIATVGANVTTFEDAGLTASTTYTYRVRAVASGQDFVLKTLRAETDAARAAQGVKVLDLGLGHRRGGDGWQGVAGA